MGCMSQSAAIKAESTCIPHCFNSFSSFSLSLCHSYSSTTTVNPEISSLFHHITVSHVLVFFVQVFLSPPSPLSLSLPISSNFCSSLMSFPTFKSSFSSSLQIFVQILCHFPLLNPLSHNTHNISSGGDNLRGFPSAISIAVMPKDQRSLYNKNKNQVKLLILHINKQHKVIFLQLVLSQ